MTKLHDLKLANFDVDKYLNYVIPPNRVRALPRPVSRFLGHAPPDQPKREVGSLLVAFWSFLGGFCGIIVICAVFKYGQALSYAHPPFIIASFGASAVLEFGVIASPLGQPRNLVFGHFVSALSGICVTKLFAYSYRFEELDWLAGALSVGLSSAMMSLTNTTHPPGGATALLAAIDPDVRAMGWSLLPFTLVASGLMLGIALIVNNIQRHFPIYYWTPKECGAAYGVGKSHKQPDLEAYIEERPTEDISSSTDVERRGSENTLTTGDLEEKPREHPQLGRSTTQTSEMHPGSTSGESDRTLAH